MCSPPLTYICKFYCLNILLFGLFLIFWDLVSLVLSNHSIRNFRVSQFWNSLSCITSITVVTAAVRDLPSCSVISGSMLSSVSKACLWYSVCSRTNCQQHISCRANTSVVWRDVRKVAEEQSNVLHMSHTKPQPTCSVTNVGRLKNHSPL